MHDIYRYGYEATDIYLEALKASLNAKTEYVWMLHVGVDYTEFDLTFVPNRFQRNMHHAWAAHNNPEAYTTWLIKVSDYPITSNNVVYHDEASPLPSCAPPIGKTHAGWHWEIDDRIEYSNFDFDWMPAIWDWPKAHRMTMRSTTQLSYTQLTHHGAEAEKFYEGDLRFKQRLIFPLADVRSPPRVDEFVWFMDEKVDYSNWDWEWLPEPWHENRVNEFAMSGTESLIRTLCFNPARATSEDSPVHKTDLRFSNIRKLPFRQLNDPPRVDEWIWFVDDRINYDSFDFDWLPERWNQDQLHLFSMKGTTHLAFTALVNPVLLDSTKIAVHHASTLEWREETKRYPLAMVNEAIAAGTDEWIWFCDDLVDYGDFDFAWLPEDWDKDKMHYWDMKDALHLGRTICFNPALFDQDSTPIHHDTDLQFKSRTKLSWDKLQDISSMKHVDEWIWFVNGNIDYEQFDFAWLPPLYEAGNIHYFSMSGTTHLAFTACVNPSLYDESKIDINHASDLHFKSTAKVFPWAMLEQLDTFSEVDEWIWFADDNIDHSDFDFTWLPEAWDKDTMHLWSLSGTTQLSRTACVNPHRYDKTLDRVFHASDLQYRKRKTMPFSRLQDLHSIQHLDEWIWFTHDNIDYADFDFSWLPDAWQSAAEHRWSMAGTTHLSFTALLNPAIYDPVETVVHHVSDLQFKAGHRRFPFATLAEIDTLKDMDEWIWFVDDRIDYTGFDFDWLPEAWQQEKIHYFDMSDAAHLSYTALVNPSLYDGSESIHHDADLRFRKPNSHMPYNKLADLEYLRHMNEWIWFLDDRIDYSKFSFSWLPAAWQADSLHKWSMEGTTQLSYTACVNPALYDPKKKILHHTNYGLRFKDTNKTHWPEGHEPLAKKILSVDRGDTEFCWILDGRIDYTGFDFDYLPDDWDADLVHAFCMKGAEQLSYTWLVRGDVTNFKIKYHASELEFKPGTAHHAYWPSMRDVEIPRGEWADTMTEIAKGLTYGNEWCWILDERIDYSNFDFSWLPAAWDTGYIHCFTLSGFEKLGYTWLVNAASFGEAKGIKYHASTLSLDDVSRIDLQMLTTTAIPGIKSQRYFGNMFDALRTAIRKTTTEWLWVTADCCEYDDFDFDWRPDQDKLHYIHCWPSNTCRKGETFLIHVPSNRSEELPVFDFDHEPVDRRLWPIQHYSVDSLAAAINIHGHKALYTQFIHTSAGDLGQPYPCLWEERPVIAMNKSGSCSLVPRDCVVKREIYEYAHLERDGTLATDPNMDVVFISNGEPQAAINRIRLNHIMNRTDGNTVGRYRSAKDVTDVQGRLNSYRAAAQKSSTDWFIAVFAKCYVTEEMNTLHEDWTPDYWQEPKHYIFHNHNMDNRLVYGHMAPIAYNRNLMLDNPGGLDITLAQPHTVVPIVLSQTSLDGDDWTNWRTAFRETIKLLHYNKTDPTVESEYRLYVWLNHGTPCSIKGAQDGKDFYERCGGEEAWLLQTVEWDWLRKYYDSL